MKHFYMVVNREKDPEYETARSIQTYLTEKGAVCSFHEGAKGDGYFYYSDASLVPKETECILVLGGDGTIIQASRDLAGCGLPLLGVKLGTLGYLTSVDMDTLFPTLDRLIQDNYEVEKRMMLDGRISVNGEILNHYTADGIIISTPTGSTAYNLSAGGPIVEPSASMILVTPVAPHTLNDRSIVLSAEDSVTIRILGGSNEREQASVAFDGNEAAVLLPGDTVTVERSDRVTKLVKLGKASFLEILREKMSN